MTTRLVARGPQGSGLIITVTEGRRFPYAVMQVVSGAQCRTIGSPKLSLKDACGHLAGLLGSREDSGKNYSY